MIDTDMAPFGVRSEAIGREQALKLLMTAAGELPKLLADASRVRDRTKGREITYSRKVFIPLTNLCRDYCGYCAFRRDPGDPGAKTLTPDEVLEIARAGERMGCTEALFSLGDKPEAAFVEMRETLRSLGYSSTLHYLEAMCDMVLRKTSLIPHPNAGLLSTEWIARLSRVSASMGLMLETTADVAAHHHAPDKPARLRLRTIEEAGKQNIPFTTGILIGIGESLADRVESLLAIRSLNERYGHVQEVIVQNFRAKDLIMMKDHAEPLHDEMMRTIAVARLMMPEMNIQAPPNLSAPNFEDFIDAGINDWGGISPLTPDYINPERPWPHLEQLRQRTEAKGCVLRRRLPVYEEFLPQVDGKSETLSRRLREAGALIRQEGIAA